MFSDPVFCRVTNHELVLGRTYFNERIARITERRTTMALPGRPRIEEEAGMFFLVRVY